MIFNPVYEAWYRGKVIKMDDSRVLVRHRAPFRRFAPPAGASGAGPRVGRPRGGSRAAGAGAGRGQPPVPFCVPPTKIPPFSLPADHVSRLGAGI